MDWTQIFQIVYLELFTIGDQPISLMVLISVALTLVVTFIVARWVRHLLEGYFLRHLPVESGAQYAVARLTQYTLWVIGLLIGLRLLNINLTAIAVVAGAIGIGIGFGLQSIVANFVAGLVLLFERPIRIKDRVTVENVEGNVLAINFRSTTILTNDNISIIVPNSEFTGNRVINWSYSDPIVRIHVPVGVSYGSDVEKVEQTLLGVAAENVGTFGLLAQPAATVRFLEFGDSSLNFELLVWTNEPARHKDLRSRLNFAIVAAFRTHGIQIPFPQRDLHLKSADALKEFFPRS